MQLSATRLSERFLPKGLAARLKPVALRVDSMVAGDDARSSAQRMSLIAFFIRVFSAAIAFFSQVLFARWMGQFEYGIFVLVWIAVVIIGNLSCFGFHTTIIRYVPEYIEKKLFGELRGILHTGRIFAVVSAGTVALLCAAALMMFGSKLQSYYVLPLYLGLISLPMVALGDMLDGTARSRSWAMTAMTPTYIVRPILTLIAMTIAHYAGFDASAVTALVCAAIATYLTTACQFLVVTSGLKKSLPQGKRTHTIRNWFNVSVPIFFVEGFAFLLINADVLMVGVFLKPDDVGVYFATIKILALVHFVYFAVKAGSAHRYSQLMHEGNTEQLTRFVRDSVSWTFWPSLLMALIVLALGYPLLALFGPSFVQGYPLLFILVFGLVARSSVGPSESLLNMSGNQRLCAAIYAVTLSLNIVLNVVLIPRFGLAGAATATAVSMIFEALTLSIAVYRRLDISMFIFSRRYRPTKLAERG